ncbi:MAG: hypothetical protein V3V01_07090 [Acidimicrobiales bacterium]
MKALAISVAAATLIVGCSASSNPTGKVENPVSTTQLAADVDRSTPTTTSEAAESTIDPASDRFPDVIEVSTTQDGDGEWRFDVTISSPYDTPERYADAFRVSTVDGELLGVRELAHDHGAEQPFTRSLAGVEIPDDITEVVVEGRDQVNGWGGKKVLASLATG